MRAPTEIAEDLKAQSVAGRSVMCLGEFPKQRVRDINGEETEVEEDRPQLPVDGIYPSNCPGIPLPNGQWLFYMIVRSDDLLKLLADSDFVESLRAVSWEELFNSDYLYWAHVFDAQARRRAVTGDFVYWRGKFSDLHPGDEGVKPFVPCIFLGEAAPDLELTANLAKRHVPALARQVGAFRTDAFYFVFDNFGIDLDGASHLDLGEGREWWPAASFPGDGEVLSASGSVELDPMRSHQTVTGVLVIPMSNASGASAARAVEFQRAHARVRRLRTLLNVAHGARPLIILAAYQYSSSAENGIWRQHLQPERYRFGFAHTTSSKLRPEALQRLVDVAFPSPKKSELLKFVHRAADSLDAARALEDFALAHVLIWASIEAILSPSDKSELIANITLTLLGLPEHSEVNRPSFWDASKSSYAVRSNIVHSFSIPDSTALAKAYTFAEEQAVLSLRYAIDSGLAFGRSRDELSTELRRKGLA